MTRACLLQSILLSSMAALACTAQTEPSDPATTQGQIRCVDTPVRHCGIVLPATPMPSKVMLVIDKSGSMSARAGDDAWGCCLSGNGGSTQATPCQGYDPNGDCKWNDELNLLLGTGGFLDAAQGVARLGLAVFPDPQASAAGEGCRDGQIVVSVPAQVGADNIASITDALRAPGLAPAGGTPTAVTLQAIARDEAFMADEPGTARYAILITDGMPNCDASLDAAQCQCTGSSCADPRLCLDDDRTVGAIDDLRAQGVQTFVVGFGSGTGNPTATQALNRMAQAGGRAQSGDRQYYQADSAADLAAILEQIRGGIQPCSYRLDRTPASPGLLEVILSDTRLAVNADSVLSQHADWDYSDAAARFVLIKGDKCGLIQGPQSGRFLPGFLQVGR